MPVAIKPLSLAIKGIIEENIKKSLIAESFLSEISSKSREKATLPQN